MMTGIETHGGSAGSVAIGQTELIADEQKAAATATKETGPLLGEPSVSLVEKGVAEMLLEAQYKTAKNTIDNMVDTPEERRKKEELRRDAEKRAELKVEAEVRADRNAALRATDPQSVDYV